jgi:hypothetical protein
MSEGVEPHSLLAPPSLLDCELCLAVDHKGAVMSSLMTCVQQDPVDQQPMQDLIPYFSNAGAAADGLHNPLSGVFWWAWNSNAGVT